MRNARKINRLKKKLNKLRKEKRRLKEIAHTKKRFSQRYFDELNQDDIKKITTDISEHKMIFLHKKSFRVSLFKGVVRGRECIIVYDRKREAPITILKPEWLKGKKCQ
jgi:hypothetical protein